MGEIALSKEMKSLHYIQPFKIRRERRYFVDIIHISLSRHPYGIPVRNIFSPLPSPNRRSILFEKGWNFPDFMYAINKKYGGDNTISRFLCLSHSGNASPHFVGISISFKEHLLPTYPPNQEGMGKGMLKWVLCAWLNSSFFLSFPFILSFSLLLFFPSFSFLLSFFPGQPPRSGIVCDNGRVGR